MSEPALLLTRTQVAQVLTLADCIAAVEEAFRLHGEGVVPPPGILGMHAERGGFHIKTGLMPHHGRHYFVAKSNANFPENRARHRLPTVQGVLILADAANGRPLAVMDSIEITIQRTGAATAVAARRLARPESRTAAICGCGVQGRVQLRSLLHVCPLERVFAFDTDASQAQAFAREMSEELAVQVNVAADAGEAASPSDIVVTCTSSRQFFLTRQHVRPGTFIAAVGADNEEKQELEPALLAAAKVVADIAEQAATIGDTHHAIAAGLMTCDAIYAELGELVAGRKPGRTSAAEITIFDSTGAALQDAAAAIAVYHAALRHGVGTPVDFAG